MTLTCILGCTRHGLCQRVRARYTLGESAYPRIGGRTGCLSRASRRTIQSFLLCLEIREDARKKPYVLRASPQSLSSVACGSIGAKNLPWRRHAGSTSEGGRAMYCGHTTTTRLRARRHMSSQATDGTHMLRDAALVSARRCPAPSVVGLVAGGRPPVRSSRPPRTISGPIPNWANSGRLPDANVAITVASGLHRRRGDGRRQGWRGTARSRDHHHRLGNGYTATGRCAPQVSNLRGRHRSRRPESRSTVGCRRRHRRGPRRLRLHGLPRWRLHGGGGSGAEGNGLRRDHDNVHRDQQRALALTPSSGSPRPARQPERRPRRTGTSRRSCPGDAFDGMVNGVILPRRRHRGRSGLRVLGRRPVWQSSTVLPW